MAVKDPGFAPRWDSRRAVEQSTVQLIRTVSSRLARLLSHTGSRLVRDPASYEIPPHTGSRLIGSRLVRDPASYGIPPHTRSHLIRDPASSDPASYGIPPHTGSRLIRDPASYGIPPHRIPPRADPASSDPASSRWCRCVDIHPTSVRFARRHPS